MSEMRTLISKLIELRKKVPYIKKEQKQYMKFSVISSETAKHTQHLSLIHI